MSIQHAMRFIQKVEQDNELKTKIHSKLLHIDLEDLVKLGADSGFIFSVSDLRIAFAKDWAARRAFYSAYDFR